MHLKKGTTIDDKEFANYILDILTCQIAADTKLNTLTRSFGPFNLSFRIFAKEGNNTCQYAFYRPPLINFGIEKYIFYLFITWQFCFTDQSRGLNFVYF